MSIQVKCAAIFREENAVVLTVRQRFFCIQSDCAITTGHVDIVEGFLCTKYDKTVTCFKIGVLGFSDI